MPDSITAIGEAAFWQCTEITAVYFGTGIKDIGLRAFYNCEKIKTVEMPEVTTEINIGIDVFDGCDALTYTEYGNCKYIGNASNPYFALIESDYYRAPNIHKDCMIIAGGAFDVFSNITEITINVPYISYDAFYNCKSLKTVTIGEKVKTIGKYAFAYCQALTTLTFEGDGTKNIRDYAFAYCKKISSIEFGDSKFNISKGAFLACTALESVNRLYAVTIEKEAFKDCTGLHSVSIYSGTVKAAAFLGCKYLYSITIGKNVTYFDAAAFAGCENIINVWFQNTSGWQCADNAEFENAVNIASSELNDRTNAATVLKKYINCIWKRTA